MKHAPIKYLIALALIVMAMGYRRMMYNSPVKGSVTPSNGAIRAWVFSRTDTVSGDVNAGNFMIENVKPGSYTLMVEGQPPYRNAVKEGITVVNGQMTDVGAIEMTQ